VLCIALFPNFAALVLFGLYLFSILSIIVVGLILKLFFQRNTCETPFIISLPAYQLPAPAPLLKSIVGKLWQFIKEAGTIIITITCVCWFLQAVPIPGSTNADGENYQFAEVDDVHDSVFGAVADTINPIFAPLGFNDWHLTSALISGFIAKEAFIGALEESYSASSDPVAIDEQEATPASAEQEEADEISGLQVEVLDSINSVSDHPIPASLALLLFILLYTPCMATVVHLGKEFDKKTAFLSLGISLSFAYIVALLVYQIGSLF
jgi:ferrous iron transport protein B